MLGTLSCIWLVSARADLPETPYVEKLRRQYEEEVARATGPSLRRFVEDIRRMEEEAVAAGDLETAILLRDRRLPAEGRLEGFEAASAAAPDAEGILLDSAAAERRGGVVLKDGRLTSWRAGKGEVVWSLRVVPGRYRVELTLSCAAAPSGEEAVLPGGRLTFAEDTALVENDILFEVLPFENWDSYRTIAIGEMEFKAANTGVKIRADEVRGEGLMRLKEVRLMPVISPPAQTRSTDLPSVAQLEEAFEALLRRRGAALTRDYLAALKKLQAAAEAADLKARLAEEIRAVTARLAED